MKFRTYVTAALVACLTRALPARASDTPIRAENVIVVTIDGFRHQEFFNGAELPLIDKKAGGVSDVDDLKRRFWRDFLRRPAERLCFLSSGAPFASRASFRRPLSRCSFAFDQWPEVFLPRLQRDLLRLRRSAN